MQAAAPRWRANARAAWNAARCRDRLYAEILKKKREMHRLLKEKEASMARQASRHESSGRAGGRENTTTGRSHVPGHHHSKSKSSHARD